MKKINTINIIILASLSFWVCLIFLNVFKVWSGHAIAQFKDNIELFLNITMIVIAWKIYQSNTDNDKKIFSWLVLSTVAIFIDDLAYYILVFVYKAPTDNMPFLGFLSFYIPYLVWLTSLITFLSKILVPKILSPRSFIMILATFVTYNIIVLSLFFLSKSQYLSDLSNMVLALDFSCFCELVLFDLTLLCLICADDIGMQFFLSGIACIISSGFLFNYSFVDQTAGNVVVVYADLCWFLALLFMFYGLLFIQKNKTYAVKDYFRKISTIKSRLILWTFGISVTSFLVFFLIAYSFSLINDILVSGLPFFITSYSVLVIILSIFMGKRFETPFKKIASNIEVFMQNKDKSKIQTQFTTEEFVFLQQFILNAFEVNEEKDRAKKELGSITAQVAHDIRSPLSALDTIVTSIQDKIPEQDRVMMRTAFRRINNIANDLVAKYKGKESNPDVPIFIYVVLKDIVCEKDLEHGNRNIRFELNLDQPKSAFLLTLGNYKEMKRMISNLINNSVNAMTEGGEIHISCSYNQGFVSIKIHDEGCGIPQERITQMLSDSPATETTLGLGLKHAKDYMKQHQGSLEITSVVVKGTEVTLKFKTEPKPEWLCEELLIDANEEIIIVDDDPSIHDTWTKKLEKFNFKRSDFFSTQKAHEALSQNPGQPKILLCDYEFMKQNESGLDFIAGLNIPSLRTYLVTSNVDQEDVIARCEDLEIQLIPKHLLPYICIQKKEEKPQEHIDLILIDDEPYNHEFWHYAAKRNNKALRTFITVEEFAAAEKATSYDTPIYIDLNLKGMSGLDVAIQLHKRGFKYLYIATGYANFKQSDYPFLAGVIGKEPPFY